MFSSDLRELVKPVAGKILFAGVVDLVSTASRVIQAVMVAQVLRSVFAGEPFSALTPWLVGFVLAQGLRALALHARDRLGSTASHRVKSDIRQRLYRKLLRLGPAYLTNQRTGVVQTTMVDSVDRLDKYVELFLPIGASSIISSVAIAVAVFIIDPVVGGVVVASALIVAFAPIFAKGSLKRAMDHWMKGYRTIYSDALDAIQGMSTLKAFNAHRQRCSELHEEAVEFCDVSYNLTFWSTIREVALGFAWTTGTTAAMLVGAWRLQQGQITGAELLLLLMLSRECFRPLLELQKVLHSTYSVPASARQIREILDAAEPLTEASLTPKKLPEGPLSVRFDDVTFAYEGAQREALEGFDVCAKAGTTLALVGLSGSGKSTAAKLLARYSDPIQGSVRLGGVDLRSLKPHDLYSAIAMVSQDTYLFYGSVAQNLRLANPKASDESLIEALKDAHAWEFVSKLDEGMDTKIGERGVRLSGGQRQRLAIARAILADARVLILDEATASVDAVSEAAIQKAIEELRKEKTLVIIAHRLSTIYSADQVVVLDSGRVIESGSPEELRKIDSEFARMVSLQSGQNDVLSGEAGVVV